ncbi:MAG: ABC transporter ATP-binding protein [Proteobacteria bacterium]|nr:ABC transporter ATP-binding protein [Pseudomonadota bacterium]
MNDAAVLLELDDVGKSYPKTTRGHHAVRAVWDALRARPAAQHFDALSGVSLRLARGASLGVIGENGAGKSTLLKIIAGVIQPTTGRVAVHGRIGALLELGSGFHPDYSGLANIDLSAALLGLSAREIRAKRDAIVEFADIGERIHEPIKHYSSGMVVRLGFAIVTAVRPDLLITDEVLAVGDESFQKKCVAWMEGYLADGGTLLLCSHSMYHVQKLCRYALWLKDGAVMRQGDAASVTQAYLAWHEEKAASTRAPIAASVASAAGVYAIQSLTLEPGDTLAQGARFCVRGDVFSPDGRAPTVLVGLVRADDTPVYGVSTEIDGVALRASSPGHYGFALEFPALGLLPGRYRVRAHALDPEGVRLFDNVELPFTVTGDSREFGLVRLPHRWV